MEYKLLLIIPFALLFISIGFLVYGYSTTGEWFIRSIDLKGGTEMSVVPEQPADASLLENALNQKFPAKVTRISGIGEQTLVIKVGPETSSQEVLQELKNQGISVSDISSKTIGPELGESFWFQAQIGIIAAFILMGVIVFIIFRTLIPSTAVILAALSDIIITLAVMQAFGIELSLAGFAALLMLIGYSIDTDILLTTRLLKDTGDMKDRVIEALKTGVTITATTVGALLAILVMGISPVLSQIASVLLIGLLIDVINTWLQNATLLRWHCERRGI